MPTPFRQFLFGRPIPTAREAQERLSNFQALAIFASDGISSTAYATQEILLVLSVAGAAGLSLTVPISLAIVALLTIVSVSYLQAIHAYPGGGGAYIVSRENLGDRFAQVAGAALLVEYVLTVAVSVSAGIAALTSAYPALHDWTVHLCVAAIGVIMVGNLRGVRESGNLFAAPAYLFIVLAYTLIALGLYRAFTGSLTPVPHGTLAATEGLTLVLALKAFSSGCAALTGLESIAIGTQAFRPPEARNAAKTMFRLAVILGTVFLGISWLADQYRIVYTHESRATVPSMLAEAVFGRGALYYAFQYATMGILILAANGSFAGFPRLSALQAKDSYLPRQLANVGERLVYNNGIIILAILTSLLVILFRGSTDHLIPLYAVGVFLSFTLCQAGMVVRWRRLRTPGWRVKALINGAGAVTTGVVSLIIAMSKFLIGAWVVVLLLPLLVTLFHQIHKHYVHVRMQLRFDPDQPLPKLKVRPHAKVLVLIPSLNKGSLPAVEFARSLSKTAIGLHITTGTDPVLVEERLHELWPKVCGDMPLIVVHSPYREVVRPILQYIDELRVAGGGGPVTVVLPEFVPRKLWHTLLHNQTGLMIKLALLWKRDVVLCNVRYYLEQ